jgi:hypothetical protein
MSWFFTKDKVFNAHFPDHFDNPFLAYFPKMKVGLSNHQSVSPPLITLEPLAKSSYLVVCGGAMPFKGTSIQ